MGRNALIISPEPGLTVSSLCTSLRVSLICAICTTADACDIHTRTSASCASALRPSPQVAQCAAHISYEVRKFACSAPLLVGEWHGHNDLVVVQVPRAAQFPLYAEVHRTTDVLAGSKRCNKYWSMEISRSWCGLRGGRGTGRARAAVAAQKHAAAFVASTPSTQPAWPLPRPPRSGRAKNEQLSFTRPSS